MSRLLSFFQSSWAPPAVYDPVPTMSNHTDEPICIEEEVRTPILKDRFLLVYWIFLIQGFVMLLPWNAFITASEFFHDKFQGSPYSNNFQSYFSIGFMLSNLIFVTATTLSQRQANINNRILFGLFGNILVFSLTIMSTKSSVFTPSEYFYFAVSMISITGVTSAYIQNGFFALVSQFTPHYTHALMSGNGVAGAAVSISQIIVISATEQGSAENDLAHAAYLYFLFALAVTFVALIAYNILVRLPLYHHYTLHTRRQHSDEDGLDVSPENATEKRSLYNVFLEIRTIAFTIAIIFIVTLGLFPSITASIKSMAPDEERNKLQKDYLFIPLHFLIFNLGDLCGRSLPGINSLIITSQKKLAILSYARIIFVPIFLACNVDVGESGTRLLPSIIKSDLLYFFFLLIFSISNGYIVSLAMMLGPQKVRDNEKEFAGAILSFSTAVGLTIGSIISFPLRAIICGCNPFLN